MKLRLPRLLSFGWWNRTDTATKFVNSTSVITDETQKVDEITQPTVDLSSLLSIVKSSGALSDIKKLLEAVSSTGELIALELQIPLSEQYESAVSVVAGKIRSVTELNSKLVITFDNSQGLQEATLEFARKISDEATGGNPRYHKPPYWVQQLWDVTVAEGKPDYYQVRNIHIKL